MASSNAENHNEGWGWFKFDSLYSEYMWVWVGLALLTLVEVFIPEPILFGVDIEFPRTFVVVSLIGLALVKTWLVAWYYMHLIAEKPAIILVAAAPFVFALFLTVGIFPWQGAYL